MAHLRIKSDIYYFGSKFLYRRLSLLNAGFFFILQPLCLDLETMCFVHYLPQSAVRISNAGERKGELVQIAGAQMGTRGPTTLLILYKVYIHGSVHRESNLMTVQQDATYSVYYISVGSSTCFGCWHPSSGAGTAVITASGIGQPGLLPSAFVVEFEIKFAKFHDHGMARLQFAGGRERG